MSVLDENKLEELKQEFSELDIMDEAFMQNVQNIVNRVVGENINLIGTEFPVKTIEEELELEKEGFEELKSLREEGHFENLNEDLKTRLDELADNGIQDENAEKASISREGVPQDRKNISAEDIAKEILEKLREVILAKQTEVTQTITEKRTKKGLVEKRDKLRASRQGFKNLQEKTRNYKGIRGKQLHAGVTGAIQDLDQQLTELEAKTRKQDGTDITKEELDEEIRKLEAEQEKLNRLLETINNPETARRMAEVAKEQNPNQPQELGDTGEGQNNEPPKQGQDDKTKLNDKSTSPEPNPAEQANPETLAEPEKTTPGAPQKPEEQPKSEAPESPAEQDQEAIDFNSPKLQRLRELKKKIDKGEITSSTIFVQFCKDYVRACEELKQEPICADISRIPVRLSLGATSNIEIWDMGTLRIPSQNGTNYVFKYPHIQYMTKLEERKERAQTSKSMQTRYQKYIDIITDIFGEAKAIPSLDDKGTTTRTERTEGTQKKFRQEIKNSAKIEPQGQQTSGEAKPPIPEWIKNYDPKTPQKYRETDGDAEYLKYWVAREFMQLSTGSKDGAFKHFTHIFNTMEEVEANGNSEIQAIKQQIMQFINYYQKEYCLERWVSNSVFGYIDETKIECENRLMRN